MNKTTVLRAFPDSRQDRLISKTLIVAAAFVAAMGVWAAFATVPEVAKTRGEILPQGGQVRLVQSLSGGKVLQVVVEEGQTVEKGDTIATVDQSVTEADIRTLEVKHADIMMRMERLRALEQNRDPDFGAEGEQFPGMAREQIQLYDSQRSLLRSKLTVIESQISGKEVELESTIKQVGFIGDQVTAIEREVQIYTDAQARGINSEAQLLRKQEEQASLRKDLEELVGRQKTLKEDISSLKAQLETEEFDTRTVYRTQRSELVEQLREVEEQLIQAHTAIGQNALVAPEAGIIKSLLTTKPGSVIQPGGAVAELVPSNQPLSVEVRVSPRDIGFIAAGQTVLIKVDAYDYSRFGAVPGIVERVSPASFKDERTGEPYFKAVISPETEYVGEESRDRRLKVGMTVEADITTGYKTIFEYLLKPVYTTVDTALTER